MYWVADSETKVDTAQVLGVARVLQDGAASLSEASGQAGFAASTLESLRREFFLSPGAADAASSARTASIAASQLGTRVEELSLWHARAASIFAAAEDDALGMFAAGRFTGEGGIAGFGLLLQPLQHIFPPAWVGVEIGMLTLNGAAAASALTSERAASGMGSMLLQGQLTRISGGLATLTGGFPWLIFARTGRSPLQQLAGSAARTLTLPQRLGWKSSKLLVTTFPARHPGIAGPGGPHWGKYMFVSAEGHANGAVVIPAGKPGSPTQASSVSLIAGLVATSPTTGSQRRGARRVPPPTSVATALEQMEGPVDAGMVEILEHTSTKPGGGTSRSWSVLIRGTKEWTAGGSNPQDMLSNLQEVGGITSDQSHAVRASMELAGIGPSEPVELVGHSQGGIVATNLAADADFTNRFAVAAVVTAGSPVALVPAVKAPSLNLENTADPVSALDGKANRSLKGRLTVYFSPDHAPPGSSAHGVSTYRSAAEGLENGQANNPDVTEWLEERRTNLNLDAATRTVSTQYWVRRVS